MENNFQFLIYRSAEENVSVDAIVKEESIWLSQWQNFLNALRIISHCI